MTEEKFTWVGMVWSFGNASFPKIVLGRVFFGKIYVVIANRSAIATGINNRID